MKELLKLWKSNYVFRTFTESAVSSLIGLVFVAYNGFLGICYHSSWNGAICIYYIFLVLIRGVIVGNIGKQRRTKKRAFYYRQKYIHTHIIIFVMNLSLTVPIAIMIKGEKAYDLGLIPAISMAAYTTYRITMSIIHYKKSRRTNNLFVKELRTLNLIDSLVAVLTLQNTMIIANSGEISGAMKSLSIISSTAIWLAIMILTVRSYMNVKN